MKQLSTIQLSILQSAADGKLRKAGASPARERTVKALTRKGLICDWKITDAGRLALGWANAQREA